MQQTIELRKLGKDCGEVITDYTGDAVMIMHNSIHLEQLLC